MARTKQTLKGDPNNPPKDLICGFCGVGRRSGIKKMIETLKLCGICKKSFPIHVKCAKVWFKHQNKKKETYDESKFISGKLKFYCNECKTPSCAICTKEHPLGSMKTYIAVCGAGHWYVSTEKCLPSLQCKTTSKLQWVCPLHQKPSDDIE